MLALVPARKGSKGLPGKNTKVFCGKPLISWTIEALLKAKSISEIIISTDDPKVVEISKKYNLKIPFLRPAYLAKDSSLAIDVYRYTINKLNKSREKKIDNFLVTLPTSPLKTYKDINEAVSIFLKKNPDSLISCTKMNHPLDWVLNIDKFNYIKKKYKNNEVKNRQKSDYAYIPNGSIYIFKTSLLNEKNNYYSKKSIAYKMPKKKSIDIDNAYDFQLAEYLYYKSNKF